MKNEKTVKLVTSAMFIAIGTMLSLLCEFVPFLNLSFGGTITICSMLPLILISYLYGIRWGLGAGFVYGILQIVVGMKTVSAFFLPANAGYLGIGVGALVILTDYILAFSALGLGGMFRNRMPKTAAIVLGGLVAMLLRYCFHIISGAVFFGMWEWFFTDTDMKNLAVSGYLLEHFSGTWLSWIYSAIYNGCYMIPDMILTSLIAIPVSRIPQIKRQ